MARSAAQTVRWNAVPPGSSGTSKQVSSPAKYASSCAAAAANGSSARSPGAPKAAGPGWCRWSVMYRPASAPPAATRVSGPTGLPVVTWVRGAGGRSGRASAREVIRSGGMPPVSGAAAARPGGNPTSAAAAASGGVARPDGAEHPVRPVVGDAGGGEVAAVEGADEHAGEHVQVGGGGQAAGRQRLPEQRPPRLGEAGLEQAEQLGMAFLLGQQRAEDGQRGGGPQVAQEVLQDGQGVGPRGRGA